MSTRKKPSADFLGQVLKSFGVAAPVTEHRFHPTRKWRMDYAWVEHKVALEVQGGIWTQGRHTRGASLLAEWEKLNTAASMGWRFLFCQPQDLLKTQTLDLIRKTLTP